MHKSIPFRLPEDRAVPQIMLEPGHLDLEDKRITEETESQWCCINLPRESL